MELELVHSEVEVVVDLKLVVTGCTSTREECAEHKKVLYSNGKEI